MSRIINGTLQVPAFTGTETPGEWTFSGATYVNVTDSTGAGTGAITTGMALFIPATDALSADILPGVFHRYKLTAFTIVDTNTIDGTVLWDEVGPETDAPTNGAIASISEVTPTWKLGLTPSDAIYAGLNPGAGSAAISIDFKDIVDKIGDWNYIANIPSTFTPSAHTQDFSTITNTPTNLSGYGITDAVLSSDSRLTDARTPVAHTQDFSTITNTPTNLSGYGITDAVNNSALGANNGVATLDAGGKLTSSQIPTALLGGMSYQGMWNATTNTPSIPAAAVGNKGYYYIVQTAGTTNVDGVTDWQPTDWIVSDGAAWVKIDNTDKVSSINGQIGIVSLGTDDVAEGATNLYYTQSRFNSAFAAKTTDDLTEGSTNLYFTNARHDYTTLGNLPSTFTPSAHTQDFSTITSTPTTVGGYGITDAVLSSDSRLTDARTPVAHNQAWSTITSTPTTIVGYGLTDAEGTITAGTTFQYWRGDKSWQTLDTSVVAEGTNLYFTTARVLTTSLTGLSTSTGGAVVATDNVLEAVGKLENRMAVNDAKTSGALVSYNEVSRYVVVSTTGLASWITSSSSFNNLIAWTRSGTSLTLVHAGHGRSAGDRVIVRNSNVDYLVATIDSITDSDHFVVTCANSGATSGTNACYGLGFTFAHNAASGSINGGTIVAPANANVVLLSFRSHLATGTRTGTTYNLVVPASATNGAGVNTGMDDVFIPLNKVHQDGASLTNVGNTIAMNVGSSYTTFQLGALPVSTTGIYLLFQF